MDEIAIVKKQVQKAKWAARIRQCSESGFTVSEWCRENLMRRTTTFDLAICSTYEMFLFVCPTTCSNLVKFSTTVGTE